MTKEELARWEEEDFKRAIELGKKEKAAMEREKDSAASIRRQLWDSLSELFFLLLESPVLRLIAKTAVVTWIVKYIWFH